jgi:alpha-tubulin suppressor-like RCC1 family protein
MDCPTTAPHPNRTALAARGGFAPHLRALAALAVLTTLASLAAACGSDHGTGPDTNAQVATITIDSASFAVERGTHFTLTATAKDDHGKVLSVPFVWRSSDESVVSVQPNGHLTALDTGTTVISASSLGVTSTPIAIRVVWVGPANIAAVNWTPPVASLPGAVVADSLRVQVTNRIGGPVPGVPVVFKTNTGGGTISPSPAITDAQGVAAAQWVLGPGAGADTVTAVVLDDQKAPMSWVTGNPVVFALTTFQALTVAKGDSQTAQILAPLPVAPSVRLVDSAGNPRPGIVVTFSASNDGHVVSPTVATGANGEASPGTWTLGDIPGTQFLVAKVGIATVTLTATATGTPTHYMPRTVAAGPFASCAINVDETASCWGKQPNVGNGGTKDTITPVLTKGDFRFASLDGGPTHFCGVSTESAIICWGVDALTDTAGKDVSPAVPTKLPSDIHWTQVSAGFAHNCGVAADSAAYCWGDNHFGQLGGTTDTLSFVPSLVAGGFKFASVVTGSGHACGLTVGGSAFCWGLNGNGQLGDGTTTNRSTPTVVAGGLTFQSLGAGEGWTCGLTTTGQPYCWGNLVSNPRQTTPKGYPTAPLLTALSVGGAHACGLSGDGTAYCWGSNNWGQLGDSTVVARDTPAPVAGPLKFTSISAGWAHTCALAKPDGAVACWGLNAGGEIGNATVAFQLTPRFIVLGVTP